MGAAHPITRIHLLTKGFAMYSDGSVIAFNYDSQRSGITRDRLALILEASHANKNGSVSVIAVPLDSNRTPNGDPGVRTFTPARMTEVEVVGQIDLSSL